MSATKQKQKSAAMRETICRATILELVEHGYHGTTTTAIAARAQVSRGAMQHHYRSRLDTIVGATKYLLADWAARVEKLARSAEVVEGGMKVLFEKIWSELFAQRRYYALMELRNACRTDKELNQRVLPLLLEWDAALYTNAHGWFKNNLTLSDENMRFLLETTRSYMRGLVAQSGRPLRKEERALRERDVDRFAKMLLREISS